MFRKACDTCNLSINIIIMMMIAIIIFHFMPVCCVLWTLGSLLKVKNKVLALKERGVYFCRPACVSYSTTRRGIQTQDVRSAQVERAGANFGCSHGAGKWRLETVMTATGWRSSSNHCRLTMRLDNPVRSHRISECWVESKRFSF